MNGKNGIYIYLYNIHFQCAFIGHFCIEMLIFFSLLQWHTCVSLMLKIHVMPEWKAKNVAVLTLDKSRHCRWPPCTLLSSICFGGVSDWPLQRGCFLYTGGLNSQRQVSAPYGDYLKRMSEWWRKVVTERETEQELFCFGIRMCYSFSVERVRGWTAVSSHSYTVLCTFIKPKALMNHTFHEKQTANILWKNSDVISDVWRWILKASESLVCLALLDLLLSFIIFTDIVQTLPACFHFTIWLLSKHKYPQTTDTRALHPTQHNTKLAFKMLTCVINNIKSLANSLSVWYLSVNMR